MNKQKQEYFRQLSLQSKEKEVPEGHVYVGFGTDDNGLGLGRGLSNKQPGKAWASDNYAHGIFPTWEYACKIPQWEQYTGLKFGEDLLSQRLYIQTFTPDISKAIQEKLFELGFSWGPGKQVICAEYPYLFLNSLEQKVITWDYEIDDEKELTIQELFEYKPPVGELKIPAGILSFEITANKTGISIEKEKISWENWAKIVAAVEEFQKAPKSGLPAGKVWIDTVNPTISAEIQKRLFEFGHFWISGRKEIQYVDNKYLILNFPEGGFAQGLSLDGYNEITIKELFDFPLKKTVTLAGITSYDIVLSDKISCGCQTTDYLNFDKLKEQIEKFRKENSF